MSRCVSLNQARAKASANCSGCSRKRREIFSYAGSKRSERSVVSIVGAWRFDLSCASGIAPAPAPFLGCHWCAPAGLLVSSHSKPNRFSKKLLLHFVGVVVQVTSRPLVMASRPLPLPKLALPAQALRLDAGRFRLGPTATRGRRRASCRRCGRRRSARRSLRRSSPCGEGLADVAPAATGSGLPFGPSGLT
jgi:hypothetical protein